MSLVDGSDFVVYHGELRCEDRGLRPTASESCGLARACRKITR